MKRYALIERYDSDSIYTVIRCAESDSLSYINKRMEKLFLSACKNFPATEGNFDRCYFVNEYARVGDKSWSIVDLQAEDTITSPETE